MKSKQEVIQEAWGDFYEKAKRAINNDGWFERNKGRDLTLLTHFDVDEMRFSGLLIRPKVLDGIETNNGWIRIESVDDIPKEITECYVFDDDGDICYYTFGLDSSKDYSEVVNGAITHYQPIIKPDAPIY